MYRVPATRKADSEKIRPDIFVTPICTYNSQSKFQAGVDHEMRCPKLAQIVASPYTDTTYQYSAESFFISIITFKSINVLAVILCELIGAVSVVDL
jgi:hypothetical protein